LRTAAARGARFASLANMTETPTQKPTTSDARERENTRTTLASAEPRVRETSPEKPFFYSPIIDTD